MKLFRLYLMFFGFFFLGLGLWWIFRQVAVAEPQATAAAESLPAQAAKAEAPKPVVTAPAKIAAPVLPPAAQPQAASAMAAAAKAEEPEAPSADPQASWKTALPDIARLLRDNDIKAIMLAYAQPANRTPELAQIGQKMNDQMQQEIAEYRMATNEPPEMVALFTHPLEGEAAILERMAEETPTLNDAGDEATFAVPEDKAKDMKPVTMIKVDGRWYLKEIVIAQGIR